MDAATPPPDAAAAAAAAAAATLPLLLQPLNVYRNGKWGKLPGDALVPGDVVSVVRSGGFRWGWLGVTGSGKQGGGLGPRWRLAGPSGHQRAAAVCCAHLLLCCLSFAAAV